MIRGVATARSETERSMKNLTVTYPQLPSLLFFSALEAGLLLGCDTGLVHVGTDNIGGTGAAGAPSGGTSAGPDATGGASTSTGGAITSNGGAGSGPCSLLGSWNTISQPWNGLSTASVITFATDGTFTGVPEYAGQYLIDGTSLVIWNDTGVDMNCTYEARWIVSFDSTCNSATLLPQYDNCTGQRRYLDRNVNLQRSGGVVNGIGGSSSVGSGGRSFGGTVNFNGTGGTPNVGGTGGGGGVPTSGTSYCPNSTNAVPCGGSVLGRWIVQSGCLTVSGAMDVSLLGLGCASVPATGHLQVSGIWTGNSDGTYQDETTTTGNVAFTLAPECLTISSVPVPCAKAASIFAVVGLDPTTCSDAQGACNCSAVANQRGGMGVLSAWAADSGNYDTAGNILTVDDTTQYSYCVANQTLTMVPLGSDTTGTVSLWKNGSTGGSTGF